MLSDIFYLIIFLSMIGSMGYILLLFIERVARFQLPLIVSPAMMLFYVIPFVIPDVVLFYHESMRIEAFEIAALVWGIGLGVSVAAMIARAFVAQKMVSKYAKCTTERVLAVYGECLAKVKLTHTPPLLFGTIKEPACVITTWRSYVVLREDVIRELTDDELKAVLTHELLHIGRRHTVLQRVFDFVCCIHWFNPVIWIGRNELSAVCEIDCDRAVLKIFDGELQAMSYAKIMVRLMELAAIKKKTMHGALGALDFWVAKHRISNILKSPSKLQKALAIFACMIAILCTVWLSANFSQSYFYPYSGISEDIEWSETE